MKKILPIFSIASACLLSACFVPEKFNATIEFQKDRSYSYSYKGTVAFLPALIDIANGKKLSADSERRLSAEGGTYKTKHPDVKVLNYNGNGRFETLIEGQKSAGTKSTILDIFVIATDSKGNQIVGANTNASDIKAFKDVGMQVNGKLTVKLPKNAKVLKNNGTLSNGFFGLGGTAVEWTIQNADQKPLLVFVTE